eukprot:scaffold6061_cov156-Amphora_coffeaeformis.AAC.4
MAPLAGRFFFTALRQQKQQRTIITGTSTATSTRIFLSLKACRLYSSTTALAANSNINDSMNQPVKFPNGKIAKNPFAIASLTNCQSNPDGTLHDNEYNWLIRRAIGGYGIINTACVHVQANGKGWEGELACFHDKHTAGLTRLAQGIHAHDALLIVQIFHAGMRADDTLIDGPARTCVDTTYQHRSGTRVCTALTADEVEQVIVDHVQAALRVQQAGGDGVEIHGAHGYLLTQFLCPDLNTRTDQWGGPDLVNRARLTREVVRRIRKSTSPDFVVGVRLSPEPGYEKAGWNMDPDENLQLAQWLVQDGVDFISVSLFGHSPTHITTKHKDNKEDAKPLLQEFRQVLPDHVVLMACGGITSGADVQTLLDMGVNVAVTGKTAISTPDFPKQVQADATYQVTMHPPYTKEFLKSVDVSPPFVEFLGTIGLVAKE